MAEERCPGEDLEDLLDLLNDRNFDAARQEPSTESARKISRLLRSYKGDGGETKAYRDLARFYSRAQQKVLRLLSYGYGESFDEIRTNLRNHVTDCPLCLTLYRARVDDRARLIDEVIADHLIETEEEEPNPNAEAYQQCRDLNRERFKKALDILELY